MAGRQDLLLLPKEATANSSFVEGPQVDLKQKAQPRLVVKKQEVQVPLSGMDGRKGYTMSLPQAAECGNLEIVRLHLRLGKDLEDEDLSGLTALLQAANNGHTEIVLLLLASGAKIKALGGRRYRALHYAADDGFTSAVHALLARGANVEALTHSNGTVLHVAAYTPILPRAYWRAGQILTHCPA